MACDRRIGGGGGKSSDIERLFYLQSICSKLAAKLRVAVIAGIQTFDEELNS